MHLLEVPAVSAGLRFDGDHRDAEKVVAGPHGAVQIGAGVASRKIDEAELGIDGRRLPHGRAAELPRVVVARPGVVTDFAGARDGIEGPDELARVGIERFHATAATAVAAGESRDDEAVVIQRRGRDAEAVVVTLRLNGPDHVTGCVIERDELAVELAGKDLAVAHRDAAAHPPAADDGDVGVEVRLVGPEDFSRVDGDREHIVGAGRNVDHAVVDERLSLARVLALGAGAVEVRAPARLELGHVVAIDGSQRRITLVVDVAPVGDPAVGRGGRELLRREGGHSFRRALCRSGAGCERRRDRRERIRTRERCASIVPP